MKKKTIWIIIFVALFGFLLIPILHILKTKWGETEINSVRVGGFTNDASQLNLTGIDTIIQVPSKKADIIVQLRSILKYAEQRNLKISIAGAQHSMGGHTIYPNGILLNMLSYKQMEFDSTKNMLTIGSGALWQDAINYLDSKGKSVAVMQAFSSFSIGGSISVNGHGWQKDSPPISSSVESFTLMNHTGEIINCSRIENPELFKLVIGGYGLFGIILDVKFRVVNNSALKFKYIELKSRDYVSAFNKLASKNPKVELVFGRLRISKKNFLDEATLNLFERVESKPLPLKQQNAKNEELKRLVFRSSVRSEYGKRLRWDLETSTSNIFNNSVFSRNELLSADVTTIENKDPTSTDILQEYFIPEKNYNQFVVGIKPILLKSKIDLLNITIRGVHKDADSYLSYANENVFGFVFLFNQQKTEMQEVEMKKLANALVDMAIKCGGTFYLPYRLHIEKSKMREVYPEANSFFQLKLKYDSKELFNNKFYDFYK